MILQLSQALQIGVVRKKRKKKGKILIMGLLRLKQGIGIIVTH